MNQIGVITAENLEILPQYLIAILRVFSDSEKIQLDMNYLINYHLALGDFSSVWKMVNASKQQEEFCCFKMVKSIVEHQIQKEGIQIDQIQVQSYLNMFAGDKKQGVNKAKWILKFYYHMIQEHNVEPFYGIMEELETRLFEKKPNELLKVIVESHQVSKVKKYVDLFFDELLKVS